MLEVLVIEDDPILARSLQINLEVENYKVIVCHTLADSCKANDKIKMALVILDLNLPDGHGFEFLKKLRDSGSRLPVIILTARSEEESVIEGLKIGANDYMRKPFGMGELMARIKAVLREPLFRETQLRYHDLLLLIDQRTVRYQDKVIDLNRREFDILIKLTERAETVISREYLLQSFDKDGEIFDRTIDSHISHIRSALKKNAIFDLKISSVYGLGYRLEKV